MEEAIATLIPLGLAVYSLLLIIKSWKHPSVRWSRIAAVCAGAGLGVLIFGWPTGIVSGLAAAAIAPEILRRWGARSNTTSVREEMEDNEPPKNTGGN